MGISKVSKNVQSLKDISTLLRKYDIACFIFCVGAKFINVQWMSGNHAPCLASVDVKLYILRV